MKTRNTKGFTLIEMVVASVIGVFITVVTVGTLRTVAAARESITAATTATDEIRFVCRLLRTDLANLYRDSRIDRIRLVGSVEETGGTSLSSLTMWVTSGTPARRSQPEGDVYEVQYSLTPGEEGMVLMRRVCPIVTVPRDDEDYVESAGGMLTTLAENIVTFQIQYYDGYEWLDQWPEEQEVLPELLQITLIGRLPNDSEGKRPIVRSIAVTFPRVAEALEATLDEEAETEFEDVSPIDVSQ
ncbi:MAG: prepilin-type N-terminal cleavage/methylation domain-containing protein [Sedimentisphaerales bacterium]|nr:prepilin-type N-terminal cleavage/methylation domain-containing protein [Sedimentisphaerales bacterium]